MTKAQKQRFLELKALGVDMNDSQQEEFDKLAEVAVKAGLDLETLQEVDQSSLTEAELAQVIKGCVQDELFGMSEQIQDRLESSATKDDLERSIKKFAGEQLNEEDLVEKIKESLPKGESLNKEDLAEAFKSAISEIRVPSGHEYPVEKEENIMIEVPFGNSKGNLTVASKQLLNVIQEKDINDGISASQLRVAKANTKAIVLSGSTGGANLVNQDLASSLEERVYLESAVANLFRAQEIQMPTSNFDIPLLTARADFALTSENANATNKEPTIAKKTLNSKKFTGLCEYSYELDEDSIIAVLPMLQDQMAKGAADALEGAILGSQAKAIAAGTVLTSPAMAIFDMGLMGQATVGVAGTSSAVQTTSDTFVDSSGDIAAARGKMGVAGIDPNALVLIITPKAYGELVGSTDLVTFDKLGSQATLITGSIGQIFGINVLVSDQFPSVPATGLYDVFSGTGGTALDLGRYAAANNAGSAQQFHGVLARPSSFKLGVRGEFSIETDRDIKKQTNQVVGSFRRAMNVMDVSNNVAVAISE
jgi:HK97 family phage major capsid protein